MNPLLLPRALMARPIMLSALGLGLAAAAALAFLPNAVPAAARPLAAWDCGALLFIALVFHTLGDDRADDFAKRAARIDEGRHLILALSTLAAAATIWALLEEFRDAKHAEGAAKAAHVVFALATVAVSWAFIHTVFAAHYAHEYYGADEAARRRGGLKFPGHDKDPDWADFVHFAFVIGAAAQTADVQIESRAIRHTATWHGVIALVFNTVILAFAVNLAASVF